MKEKDMRPIVELWLQHRGYYVAHEVMLFSYCDMIGCKWAERIGRKIPPMTEIIAVELKVTDIKGVIYQAKNNCYCADYSYAAMPFQKCESMRAATLKHFTEKGVGLLGVDNGVNIIIEAQKNEISHHKAICKRLWNFRLRHTSESRPACSV